MTNHATPTHAAMLYRFAADRIAARAATTVADADRERARQARAAARLAALEAPQWAPGVYVLADVVAWTGYPTTTRPGGATRPACAAIPLGDGVWAISCDRDTWLVTLLVPCGCGAYTPVAVHGPDDVARALAPIHGDSDGPICPHALFDDLALDLGDGDTDARPAMTCPRRACRSTATEEYAHPVPHTDDAVDRARCRTCGHDWALDPAADITCVTCAGSGTPGATGDPHTPKCPCVATTEN